MTDSLWSILRYGGDTRKQPILICITTDGTSQGKSTLCWGEHEYVTRILDEMIEDDQVTGFILLARSERQLEGSACWVKANPSLGSILPLSALQNQLEEAVGKPTATGQVQTLPTKHLDR